jgi:hypothetical protein
VWERLRERAGDWPPWKLVGAAVAIAAATGVAIALIGAHHGSPPPQAGIAAALIVSGDRPEVPAAATAAAERFLAGYLPFLYGQMSAGQLHGLTPALRRSLARQRGRVTPTERARHPRVLQLEFAPGDVNRTVLFEAVVSDDASRYRVRLRVAIRNGRWTVVELPDAHVAVGPNGAD